MYHSTRVKWMIAYAIAKGMAFWLGLFYVLWALRFVAQGELVTGTIMTAMFGLVLYYFARAMQELQAKSLFQGVLSLTMSGAFAVIWYDLLKILNDFYVNGTTLPVARLDPEGYFGIHGYWGMAIIIPVYVLAMLVLIPLINIIADMNWKYEWQRLKRSF